MGFHGIQIALESLDGIGVPLGAPHKQDFFAAVLHNQVLDDVEHALPVVGDDVVAVGQLHLFGDDHQGAAVVAPGEAPGVVPVHVKADGSVVDDVSVGTADTAVVVNSIELVVIDVIAEITQNTLKEGLGVNPQEEIGIDVLLLGSGNNPPNHLPGEVGVHAANHYTDGLPLFIVHGITSCVMFRNSAPGGRGERESKITKSQPAIMGHDQTG